MSKLPSEKDRIQISATVYFFVAVYEAARFATDTGVWWLWLLHGVIGLFASYFFIGYAFRDLNETELNLRLKRKNR